MSRRPQSLAAYARRRARSLGLLLVLLLGSLLVAALTDRGHDPVWTTRGTPSVAIALSDDADLAYVLRVDEGIVTALEARRGSTGALFWSTPMNDTRALLAAGEDWVAVATDFPRAFLTYYGEDGSARFQDALEGNPRALAGEGDLLALALQAPGNPVLAYENSRVPRTFRFDSFVNSIDVRGHRIAIGTGGGDVVVLEANGTVALNATLPISVRSIRLSDDGQRVVVGGFSRAPGDLSGLVAAYDLGADAPLRWTYATRIGVGYVDLDRDGVWAIAVEESPPRNTIHGFSMGEGRPLWSRSTGGEVAQDDAGSLGGVALSPDGDTVAVGTLHGRLQLLDMDTGRTRWTYRIDGTTAVTYSYDDGERILANARLSLNAPYEGLLLFSSDAEPPLGRLAYIAGGLTLLAIASAATLLGVGYWRLRKI